MIAALLLAAATPQPVQYACTLALVTPQGQFTDSTPVTIAFTIDGKALHDVHVVDAGGILYPGGNMRLTRTPDAVSLGGVPFPAERPGTWTGKVEKKMYRLKLKDGAATEGVELDVMRTPVPNTNRLGVTWRARHLPEGMPRALSGQGVGQCGQPVAGAVQ